MIMFTITALVSIVWAVVLLGLFLTTPKEV